MRKQTIVVLLMLLMVVSPAWAELSFVQSVVDGNTLKLINGENLKLIGVNIPAGKEKEAKDMVKGMVSGSVVSVEYDKHKRDLDGNLQGYVWFQYSTENNFGLALVPSNYEARYVLDEKGKWTGVVMVLLNATVIKSGLATPEAASSDIKYGSLFNDIYKKYQTTKADVVAQETSLLK